MGLLDRLKQGLQKTKQVLFTDVRDLMKPGRLVDQNYLDEWEQRMIRTDMGIGPTDEIIGEIREQYWSRVVSNWRARLSNSRCPFLLREHDHVLLAPVPAKCGPRFWAAT